MVTIGQELPGDFMPVNGVIPQWIDVGAICRDAKRYVGLYAVANFDVVAINSGQCVYTTSDRNGEFRRTLRKVIEQYLPTVSPAAADKAPTLIYDCEGRREWIAPRESAVKFLYAQF